MLQGLRQVPQETPRPLGCECSRGWGPSTRGGVGEGSALGAEVRREGWGRRANSGDSRSPGSNGHGRECPCQEDTGLLTSGHVLTQQRGRLCDAT